MLKLFRVHVTFKSGAVEVFQTRQSDAETVKIIVRRTANAPIQTLKVEAI